MAWIKIERVMFTLLVTMLLAGAIQVARGWAIRASIIILVLGGIGLALALRQFVSDIKSVSSEHPDRVLTMEAPAAQSEGRWGNLEIWAWILGFYAAIHVIGFLTAVPLFVVAYTRAYGGGWILSLPLGAVAWGFVYTLFDVLLHVPWPEPLIQSLFLMLAE